MKKNKIISTILAFVMIFGAVSGILPLLSVPAAAAADDDELGAKSAADYAKEALHQSYLSAEDKVNIDPNMTLWLGSTDPAESRYALYCNPYTGEVYVRDNYTGRFLVSNPYDIGDGFDSDTIPAELMSQIEITFTKRDGSTLTYNSYDWAASRGQIYPTLLSDGLRMEYTIGDTTTRYLVPNGISRERFWTLIIIPAQQQLLATIRGMFENLRGRIEDPEIPEEEQLHATHANDAALIALFQEVSNNPGAYNKYTNPTNINGRISWDSWDGIIDFIMTGYDPVEAMDGGKNIIQAFDDWYRIVYLYYKVFTSVDRTKIGKNFVEFSKMGNATADYFSLCTNYDYKNPNDNKITETYRQDMIRKYPATVHRATHDESGNLVAYFDLYALSDGLTNANKRKLQRTINKYAPNYTLDMMYEDEAETELEPEVEVNPIFRLSLEYRLTDHGVSVTLPANSIYYDEYSYTITSLKVLPYMGTGRMTDGGYIFYPDGSGAIVDYDDFAGKNIHLTGPVYGQDYAFHASAGANQQPIRMPVYGAVSDKTEYYLIDIYTGERLYVTREIWEAQSFTYKIITEENERYSETEVDEEGNPVKEKYYLYYYESGSGAKVLLPYAEFSGQMQQYYLKTASPTAQKVALRSNVRSAPPESQWVTVRGADVIRCETCTDGFFAVIEDGAAMCDITLSITGLSNNPYGSVYTDFKPLPQDTYNLSEARAGASGSVMFTVTSREKYMDNLVIDYHILSDPTMIETDATGLLAHDHPASYVGMAAAYRDYLSRSIAPLTGLQDSLPLFIETFGVIETVKKILTFPVEVKEALTSFDDVENMYKELSDAGITNIKFRLTGYYNGGMDATYPVRFKWERKAGGKSGFKDLLAFAADRVSAGLEIFPDVELQYAMRDRSFDGFRRNKHVTRTVDNRYAIKRLYSGVTQSYDEDRIGWIVSPTWLTDLYDKFDRRYSRYDVTTISLSTLAADLSSNYDEDEIMLREEAMHAMQDFLRHVSEDSRYRILSEGGNAYALPYVDYLLDAPIDSSHFRSTSYTVPFFGMVMHGLVTYTGGTFNEEGNPDYMILRSIESGASLYFLLSYRNTNLMKDDRRLSEYYSVNYQIWSKGIARDGEEYYYRDLMGRWHTVLRGDDDQLYYLLDDGVTHQPLEDSALTLTYTEYGDVYKYYNILNDAIGGLQDYTISDHARINAERLIEESEVVANRLAIEDEFLQSLRAHVTSDVYRKKSDLALLRQFYLASIDLLIRARDGTVTDAARQALSGDAHYADYLTTLETYYDSVLSYAESNIKNKLQDEEIRRRCQLDTQPAGFAENFVSAILAGDLDLRTGQVVGVSLDTDALLDLALQKTGIGDEAPALTIADFADVGDAPAEGSPAAAYPD
ncbi:MAG: hypothetical protein J6125_02510, partial [Clostridia bacterium]|nr:hypothetical protein [Clostridia bacterium]